MKKLTVSQFFATLAITAMVIGSFPSSALALDTGFLSPTSESALTDWTNGDRAYSSNDSYATSGTEGQEQGYDTFNIPAIPAGSIINGIEVTIEARSNNTGCSAFAAASWNNGSTFTAAKNTSQLSGSDVVYTLGGSSDTWGRTWSVSDFTNANFVLKMYYDDLPPGTACPNGGTTVSVDHVRVKVYHSPDTTAPAPTAITRAGSNPSNAASVTWNVGFTESVTGVTTADFTLSGTAVSGASITGVSGSGSTYTVTATTGSGSGTLGLNMVDDDTIQDGAGNKLGGTGANSPGFPFAGDEYTIDKTVPVPTITQALGQTDPTSSSPINFTVAFSEPVSGFSSASDVTIGGTTTGTKTSTITPVSSTVYNVAVSGMTSSGTVTITIPAGAATDGLNTSSASINTDNSVQYDIPTFDILATAGVGGTITPSGIVTKNINTSQAFSTVPAAGHIVSDVSVDGSSQGRIQNYTFSNITANHTIASIFDGGWYAPSTTADGDNDVTGEGSTFVSDNAYATLDSSNDEADLYTFNLSIPAGATIDGIEVAVEGSTTGRDPIILLSKNNGSTFPYSITGNFDATERTIVLGGPTNLWTTTWTAADLSNANFRVRIGATTGGGTVSVDQVQVKVYYTLDTTAPAGGSITYTDGYYTALSVPVTYALGTDSGAGLDTASGKIQRASATLSGGTCGSFSAFSDLVTEFDGSYTDTSVVNGTCYQYQYVISDLAGPTPNTATYTSANVVKVDTQVPSTSIAAAQDGNAVAINLGGGTLTKSNVINFSFTPVDAESGVASSECKLDAGAYAPCSPALVSYTGLSDGMHTVYVRSTDNAGNLESTATLTWEVDQTAPVITILGDQPDSVVYGAAYSDDGATALDARDGDVTVNILTVNPVSPTSPVGPYTVTYNVTDAAGNAAVEATRTVHVTQATLTVTADGQSKVYGAADPSFDFEYSGFVNGDDAADIDVAPTCAVVPTHIAVGNYAISCSGGSDNNYTFAFVDGNLEITPATLTVDADNKTKTYGNSDPALTYVVTGLQNGDLEGTVVSGALTRDTGEDVGLYDILVGTVSVNGNYTLNFVGGELSITARPVEVTADPQTKVYGAADPALTYQITSGTLAFSDSFTGALTRAAGENVGDYAITLGTLSLGTNYDLTYIGDDLSITPATLTVTANPQTKVYGAADPTLTYGVVGLQFSDTVGSVLTGGLTRAAGESVLGSPYAITQGTLVSNANYTIAFTGNALTITPAALTVTASNGSMVYGGTVPTITPSYSGFQFGELVPDVVPVCTTDATVTSPVGTTYVSSCVGAADSDYTISYVDGSVEVTKASISVAADNKTKVYGEANPTLTGVITGILNGDAITATYSTTADTNSPVGDYDIVPELQGAALSNYNVPVITNGTLSITKAPSTVTVVCTDSTYDGSAQETCTGSVSGVNLNIDVTDDLVYTNNVDAGTESASASYTYIGDVNHEGSSGSDTFSIAKAGSTTVVTCPVSVVFNNAAQTPCTVSVTGAGGLNLTPAPLYASNTNVGTATASYEFVGDDNHNGSDDSTTFEITKADTITVVTCTVGPFVYTGSAIETCTAEVTGPGLSESVPVTYTNNVNTGTAEATATYPGAANYNTSTDSETFEIVAASSTTVVTCPASVVYDGSAQEPCSVLVTGAGVLSLTPDPTYTNNTDVGTASASYTYAGDSNHAGSSDSENFAITVADAACVVNGYTGVYDAGAHGATGTCTGVNDEVLTGLVLGASYTNVPGGIAHWTFTNSNYAFAEGDVTITINKADPTITVTGYDVVYDGAPHTSTGTAVGVLSEPLAGLDLSATEHTDAGTYSDAWTFTDVTGNYNDDTGSVDNKITAAETVTTVTCDPASVVYTGSAHVHCTAKVAGVNGFEESLTVTYADNVDAGTATASASFPGDENNAPSEDDATFTILKAESTTTLICPDSVVYDSTAKEPCTANVTGAGGLNESITVTYGNNTDVGTATADATYAGDSNHTGSSASDTFTITQATLTPTIVASDKPYDGTTVASVTCSVSPILDTDVVTCAPALAAFEDANVGTWTVTATGITLSGAQAANYTLTTDSATDDAVITEAETTTTISVAPEPSVVGQTYTVSWTVTALAGTPTGTVSVTVDGNPGCSAAVEAGECDITGLAAGTNDLVATYSGDSNFNSSASDAVAHVVAKAGTTLDITNQAALNVSTTIGGGYPVTWTVLVTAPGAGTPTGTVTVSDGTDECSAAVAAGTCMLTSYTSGDKTLTATYAGDTNFLGSSDTGLHDVDKQGLVVIADSKTKVYGEADPTFTYSLTGFVEGVDDTLNTPPTCTVSGAHVNVGVYTITCGGGADDNYSFVYFPGATLTVTKAPLTVTASSDTMVYGGTVPTITPSYATFVNGDDAGDLDVQPICGTTATAASPVGSYGSSCAGAVDGNYTFTYVGGTVTVDPAALTITANDATKELGATHTFIGSEFTTSALVGSDSVTSVTLTSTGAAPGAAVGTYDIVASDAVGTGLTNYTITYVDGTLTVEDTTAPETTITVAPTDPTEVAVATFEFESSEAGSTFTCALDADVPAPCTSPYVTAALADGAHTFSVFATDAEGNDDLTPATHAWTVNAVGPVITDEDASLPTDTTVTVTWTTDEPSTSKVVYDTVSHEPAGAAPEYGYAFSTVEDPTLVTLHSVVVTGLTPGTQYYFRGVSHGSPETISNEVTETTTEPVVETTITVTKVVVGNPAFDASDFPLFVDETPVTSGVPTAFAPGEYTVHETGMIGFIPSFSGACVADEMNDERIDQIHDWVVKRDALMAAIDAAPEDTEGNAAKQALIEDAEAKIAALYNAISATVTVSAGQNADCTITNTYESAPVETATVVASKIVCDSEEDLPDWGTGGPNITEDTAADFVVAHPNCHLAAGWDFEWAPSVAANPGDTLVGAAGNPWTTFGTTDETGSVSTEVPSGSLIWLREVLKDGYIPFTYGAYPDNSDDVSAEFYCNTDVLNYDNFDWINPVEAGETYYCVAFNAPKVTTAHIIVDKVTDPSDDPTEFSFTASFGNFTLTDAAEAHDTEVAPGEYSISENETEGWTLSGAVCTKNDDTPVDAASFTVAAGDTVTCVFTNTKNDESEPEFGKLVVIKKTKGANGTFSFDGGEVLGDFSISTHHKVGFKVFKQVPVGEYSIDEDSKQGWTEIKNTCDDITITAGKTKVCYIVNKKSKSHHDDDEDDDHDDDDHGNGGGHGGGPSTPTGKIVVKKVTVGGEGTFTFTTNYSSPFNLSGGQTSTSTEFVGNKMVSETPAEGWTLTSATCVSSKGDTEVPGNLSLQSNETITCTFVNTKDAVVDEEDENDDQDEDEEENEGGSGGGSGGGSEAPAPAPILGGGIIGGGSGGGFFGGSVLGAQTGQVLGESCGLYMDRHLKRGSAKNQSEQVKKLQEFLNKEVGAGLPATGYFGPMTENAVKKFQSKYADDILKPWNTEAPTGLVYLSTVHKINKIWCPALTLTFPTLVEWSKNPQAE